MYDPKFVTCDEIEKYINDIGFTAKLMANGSSKEKEVEFRVRYRKYFMAIVYTIQHFSVA